MAREPVRGAYILSIHWISALIVGVLCPVTSCKMLWEEKGGEYNGTSMDASVQIKHKIACRRILIPTNSKMPVASNRFSLDHDI